MYQEQRHSEILNLLEAQGRVSVAELAEQFQVTTETSRRDLDHLASLQQLVRVHGGAIARKTAAEPDLPTKLATNVAAKARIGKAVATLLEERRPASLAFDAGSTTEATLAALHLDDTVLVTGSIPVAQAAVNKQMVVHMLPGRVRRVTQAAVGAATQLALEQLHPEVAVLGCNGMSEAGFTTPNPEEGAVKRALVKQSGFTIVAADSSKVGLVQLTTFAEPGEIDVLVTDKQLPRALEQSFKTNGIEVIYA